MTFQAFLQTLPDYETVLQRFGGNEALLLRFVRKFPAEPTFGQLRTAMEAGDWKGVETAAHTLKGIAGNLGFQQLFSLAQKMVDAVRKEDLAALPALWQQTEAEYSALCERIALLDA